MLDCHFGSKNPLAPLYRSLSPQNKNGQRQSWHNPKPAFTSSYGNTAGWGCVLSFLSKCLMGSWIEEHLCPNLQTWRGKGWVSELYKKKGDAIRGCWRGLGINLKFHRDHKRIESCSWTPPHQTPKVFQTASGRENEQLYTLLIRTCFHVSSKQNGVRFPKDNATAVISDNFMHSPTIMSVSLQQTQLPTHGIISAYVSLKLVIWKSASQGCCKP